MLWNGWLHVELEKITGMVAVLSGDEHGLFCQIQMRLLVGLRYFRRSFYTKQAWSNLSLTCFYHVLNHQLGLTPNIYLQVMINLQ